MFLTPNPFIFPLIQLEVLATLHITLIIQGLIQSSQLMWSLVILLVLNLRVRIQWASLAWCAGFGQDRTNFHWNPGRDTAGRADPTWPNRAGYSIPCAVMLGSGWGELGSGNSLAAREHVAAAVGESCSLRCAVCAVYSPYLYRCCYCSLCLLFC